MAALLIIVLKNIVDYQVVCFFLLNTNFNSYKECLPGYTRVGPTCVSYAVTGGECSHPIQCLTGSVCMHGKCRGPCDDNQLFIKDQCVDYGFI